MKVQGVGPAKVLGRNANWLELAVAPAWRLDKTEVHVHPMEGGGKACYALTLDKRWLCGSDNALSMFKSLDAAQRFLSMLRVPRVELGEGCSVEGACNGDCQCFCLGRHGLTPCEECEVGKRRNQKASEAAFEYWGDD